MLGQRQATPRWAEEPVVVVVEGATSLGLGWGWVWGVIMAFREAG